MHCSLRLIVQTLVFSRSYLHRQVSPPENLVVKGGTTWARNGRNLGRKLRLPLLHFRVLLLAGNMRHGANGFTSLPKASTLPLDHRSRLHVVLLYIDEKCHNSTYNLVSHYAGTCACRYSVIRGKYFLN